MRSTVRSMPTIFVTSSSVFCIFLMLISGLTAQAESVETETLDLAKAKGGLICLPPEIASDKNSLRRAHKFEVNKLASECPVSTFNDGSRHRDPKCIHKVD